MSQTIAAATNARDRQRAGRRGEQPLGAGGLRRLALGLVRLVERVVERALGPGELERQHRQADRDDHERRAGRHEHGHAGERHDAARDANTIR